MLVLKLDTKKCMSELLLKETFDSFIFIEGDITTFNQFHIDGYLQKKFFSVDDIKSTMTEDYSFWQDVREFCFSLIKGKRTPLDFKLVFSLTKPEIEKLLTDPNLNFSVSDVQGLYLNFKYNGEALQCITGTSLTTFIPDKSLEHAWDKAAQQLFDTHGINCEIVE